MQFRRQSTTIQVKRRRRKLKTGKKEAHAALYTKMRLYMSCIGVMVREDLMGGSTGRKAGSEERLERELKRQKVNSV